MKFPVILIGSVVFSLFLAGMVQIGFHVAKLEEQSFPLAYAGVMSFFGLLPVTQKNWGLTGTVMTALIAGALFLALPGALPFFMFLTMFVVCMWVASS